MTPTDADREKAREWIARQRSYDPVPELTVDLLAELVAAGRAEERERAANRLITLAALNTEMGFLSEARELRSASDAIRRGA